MSGEELETGNSEKNTGLSTPGKIAEKEPTITRAEQSGSKWGVDQSGGEAGYQVREEHKNKTLPQRGKQRSTHDKSRPQ